MKTITVMDPVTRIEGHMKVAIAIETNGGQQQIVDSHCTETLFRGFETLLNRKYQQFSTRWLQCHSHSQ